jgi:hypothetical protein
MTNEVLTDKNTTQSKKEMIISLFKAGVTEIETIAAIAGSKPSYVGSVLQNNGLIDNYYDLYTSSAYPVNVYSKYFRGKLGFKDVKTAIRGVRNLDISYYHFERIKDRAGQHHTLEMGLTMLDRARWTGKMEEAEIYRKWLVGKLSTPLVENSALKAVETPEKETVDAAEDMKLAA